MKNALDDTVKKVSILLHLKHTLSDRYILAVLCFFSAARVAIDYESEV